MAVKSLIQTVTVGAGGAASIEFTAIPQDGSDLVCVMSIRTTDNVVSSLMRVQLAGDTGSNYSFRRLYGSGSSALSSAGSSQSGILAGRSAGANATSNTFSNTSVYVANYTSTANKSVSVDSVTENNASEAYQHLSANLHSTSVAVTSFLIKENSGTTLLQYSTASLFKIKYD
jgi:hypothetical protein